MFLILLVYACPVSNLEVQTHFEVTTIAYSLNNVIIPSKESVTLDSYGCSIWSLALIIDLMLEVHNHK